MTEQFDSGLVIRKLRAERDVARAERDEARADVAALRELCLTEVISYVSRTSPESQDSLNRGIHSWTACRWCHSDMPTQYLHERPSEKDHKPGCILFNTNPGTEISEELKTLRTDYKDAKEDIGRAVSIGNSMLKNEEVHSMDAGAACAILKAKLERALDQEEKTFEKARLYDALQDVGDQVDLLAEVEDLRRYNKVLDSVNTRLRKALDKAWPIIDTLRNIPILLSTYARKWIDENAALNPK